MRASVGYGDGWYRQRSPARPAGTSSDRPVIPSQRGRPASSRSVGATSARTPSSRLRPVDGPARRARTGTGLSEWAVTGLPSASRMSSALPWSAVIASSAPGPPGSAASTAVERVDDPAEAGVDGRQRRRPWRPNAGVADHVRVGEVGDDEVVAGRSDRLDERVGRRPPRSSPAGGRRSRPSGSGRGGGPRPASGASTPPLKKYVTWAYFSVSATWNWRQPASRDGLGQRARHLGRERDLDRQARLVLGHRHDEEVGRRRAAVGRRPVEAVERRASASAWVSWRARSARKLAWMIGSPSRTAAVDAVDDGRGHELVVLAARVGGLDRGGRGRCGVLPYAVDDRVVAALDPLPAPVAVHREVAAADGRDAGRPGGPPRAGPRGPRRSRAPSAAACRGRRAGRGRGRRGTPRRAASSASATRWRSLAWTPPGPDEADDVEPAAGRVRPARRPRASAGPLEERAVGDRGVDPRQVLEHRPAGAEVEVADLGVAHLARRQPDRVLGRLEAGVRPAREQRRARAASARRRSRPPAGSRPIPNPSRTTRTIGRGRRSPLAVTRPGRAPARSVPARATIPAISSGLSEAPPTSAPSIDGLGQELADVRRR